MKGIVSLVAITSVQLLAPTADAQGRGAGRGGCCMSGAYARLYDPAAVTTVSGVVSSVGTFTDGPGGGVGVRAVVKFGSDEMAVHLGPQFWLDAQPIKIVAGDRIEITGSKVTFNNAPAIIASSVKKGTNTLTLRDSAGMPAWRGMRRGRGGPPAAATKP